MQHLLDSFRTKKQKKMKNERLQLETSQTNSVLDKNLEKVHGANPRYQSNRAVNSISLSLRREKIHGTCRRI